MTTYYISGPMRGYPRFNFDAFLECEKYLKTVTLGSTFHNPAQKDLDEGVDPENEDVTEAQLYRWMRRDLTDVAASDVIVLLPGWETSEGARRELSVAKWCGLQAFEYDPSAAFGFKFWSNGRTYDELAEKALAADAEKSNGQALVDEEMATTRKAFTELWAREIFGFDAEDKPKEGLGEIIGIKDLEPEDLPLAAEVRITNKLTGGEKGSKPERYDLVPVRPLAELAKLYGYGAQKYEDRNWEKGYDWSLSYAALQRHANAFWSGQTVDPESGCHHLASVVFHAFAMIEWGVTHPELDNRP